MSYGSVILTTTIAESLLALLVHGKVRHLSATTITRTSKAISIAAKAASLNNPVLNFLDENIMKVTLESSSGQKIEVLQLPDTKKTIGTDGFVLLTTNYRWVYNVNNYPFVPEEFWEQLNYCRIGDVLGGLSNQYKVIDIEEP